MNNRTTIEVDQHELEAIERQREAQQRAEQERVERQKREWSQRKEQAVRYSNKIGELANMLIEEDSDLFKLETKEEVWNPPASLEKVVEPFTTTKYRVYFMFNNSQQDVDIREHRVSTSGWSSRSNGVKYFLNNSLNSYSRRAYKTPASVAKKVRELIQQHTSKEKAEEVQKQNKQIALEYVKSKFPGCEVKLDYRFINPGTRYVRQVDFITVNNSKVGKMSLNFRVDKDSSVEISISSFTPYNESKEKIFDLFK